MLGFGGDHNAQGGEPRGTVSWDEGARPMGAESMRPPPPDILRVQADEEANRAVLHSEGPPKVEPGPSASRRSWPCAPPLLLR